MPKEDPRIRSALQRVVVRRKGEEGQKCMPNGRALRYAEGWDDGGPRLRERRDAEKADT